VNGLVRVSRRRRRLLSCRPRGLPCRFPACLYAQRCLLKGGDPNGMGANGVPCPPKIRRAAKVSRLEGFARRRRRRVSAGRGDAVKFVIGRSFRRCQRASDQSRYLTRTTSLRFSL
jgi:hypothetical protein